MKGAYELVNEWSSLDTDENDTELKLAFSLC